MEQEAKTSGVPGSVRLHLILQGRVQGVGFRWFTRRAACARALGGHVRNLPDGRVEIEVEGPPSTVDDFVETVRKGPPASRVLNLDRRELPAEGTDGFRIAY